MNIKKRTLCICMSVVFVFTLFASSCKSKENTSDTSSYSNSEDNSQISSGGSDTSLVESTDDFTGTYEKPNGGEGTGSEISGTENKPSDDYESKDENGTDGDNQIEETVNITPVNPKNGTEVSGSERTISIQTSSVAYENFMSFGANVSSGIMTDEGRAVTGMNDAYFEIERARYLAAKPQFCRLLFPIDYMITDTEENPKRTDFENNSDYINYKNGIYDFDGDRMQAVCDYMDILKACGSKVYINFGFHNASRIQNWFSIREDVAYNCAPADTDLFANACAALLKYLIKTKGYDNIIGVSFYNEPNGAGFSTIGSKESYYISIIKKVYNALQKAGLNNIGVYGPEVSNIRENNHSWLDLLSNKVSSYISALTAHNYYTTITQVDAGMTEIADYNMLYSLGGFLYGNYSDNGKKAVYLTEFNTGNYDYNDMSNVAVSEGGEWTWNTSNASYFIACANSGISGACRWSYSGQYWTDPLGYGSFKDNYHSLWLCPLSQDTVENGVMDKFYEESLLTNYVKAGSDVLKVDWSGTDTRVAAFKLPDGNYTVIVEVNDSDSERNISINFDKAINKTFYKMSFSHDVINEANALVPSCEKKFTNIGKSFNDTVNSNYAYYVYTTCSPVKQIKLNKVTVTLKADSSWQFTADLIDASSSDKVKWSVSSAVDESGKNISRKGSVNNGKYIPDSQAKVGDIIAVRAELESDPTVCAVAIIEISD